MKRILGGVLLLAGVSAFGVDARFNCYSNDIIMRPHYTINGAIVGTQASVNWKKVEDPEGTKIEQKFVLGTVSEISKGFSILFFEGAGGMASEQIDGDYYRGIISEGTTVGHELTCHVY